MRGCCPYIEEASATLPKLDPFTTLLDLKLGALDPERGDTQVRTQSDLRTFWICADTSARAY